jgi:TonB family protein
VVRRRTLVSLTASVIAHAGAISIVGVLAWWSLLDKEKRLAESRARPLDEVVAVDLPVFSEGSLLADRDEIREGEAPTSYGGAAVARVDDGVAGRGGDATGARATNLAAYDDGMRLDPDLLSRLDRDQQQRLRTAPERTTREDRRATTNPMELTFLATGKGTHQERRPSSEIDPSRGSLSATPAQVAGGRPGASGDMEDEGPNPLAGAAQPGQLLGSPGLGVRDGRSGTDHRRAARVALGRPAVTEGAPTVTAANRGRANDTVDSDQEVSSVVRSLVHASVAGGAAGQGRGGSAGPETDPGAGGANGKGSVARPLGTGEGDVVDFYTTDPLLMPYFRKLHAKIHPLWKDAFPKSAMLELKQGTVILDFTIAADGTVVVAWPPVRASGVDEFDRNCADAIRRAAPFEPIPAQLGRSSLKIRAPFVAKNPIVK